VATTKCGRAAGNPSESSVFWARERADTAAGIPGVCCKTGGYRTYSCTSNNRWPGQLVEELRYFGGRSAAGLEFDALCTGHPAGPYLCPVIHLIDRIDNGASRCRATRSPENRRATAARDILLSASVTSTGVGSDGPRSVGPNPAAHSVSLQMQACGHAVRAHPPTGSVRSVEARGTMGQVSRRGQTDGCPRGASSGCRTCKW